MLLSRYSWGREDLALLLGEQLSCLRFFRGKLARGGVLKRRFRFLFDFGVTVSVICVTVSVICDVDRVLFAASLSFAVFVAVRFLVVILSAVILRFDSVTSAAVRGRLLFPPPPSQLLLERGVSVLGGRHHLLHP